MNTKFKVGDRVRVVNTSYDFKKIYIGTVHTITSVETWGVKPRYVLGEPDAKWIFYDEDLELVKPKFNINNYKNKKYAIRIRSKNQAIIFNTYFNGDRDYKVHASWDFLNEYFDICFDLKDDCHSEMTYYVNNGYKILEFEDFDWSDFSMKKEFTKKDLKNGDIVKFRKGYTGIVILETGTIVVGEHDYMPLDSTANDLTQALGYSNDRDFDIVAVRRPNKPHECSLQAFKNNYGTLVYERKEVEEMTLEEICKALGKEIKIVKEKR